MKLHFIHTRFFSTIFPLLASAALGFSSAEGAVIFTPQTPSVLVDFEGMTSGQKLSDAGWSGGGAASISGTTPRTGSGGATGNIALQAADSASASDYVATSALQTLNPAFTLSDTVYFSAYINRTSTLASGARVTFRNASNQLLGGFGIINSGPNYFSAYYNGAWNSTTVSALANKWYEVALVIQLNATDVTQSLGYLFVRNVTDGGDFELLTSENGFNMGYTESFNATQFSSWRLSNFRNGAQVDNLAAGLAAIPEPSSTAFVGGSLLLAGLGRFAYKSSQGRKAGGR